MTIINTSNKQGIHYTSKVFFPSQKLTLLEVTLRQIVDVSAALKGHHNLIKTRGQRPNESQKVVIIYMMKSVGEIASKMWPVV